MANCVTQTQKNSAEYRAAMDKFNISSRELEMILHEYQNAPENAKLFQAGKLPFPSETYLQEHVYAPASFVSDNTVIDLWEKNFSKPIIVNNRENAEQIVDKAARIFNVSSIVIRETKDGKYQVLVTKPINDGETSIYASRQEKIRRQGIQSIDDIFNKNLFGENEDIELPQAIEALAKNKEIAPLVDLLRHLNKNMPKVTLKLQERVIDNRGIERDGLYNASTNTIIISKNTSKPVGQVVAHEILHPLFLDKLNTNPKIRQKLETIIDKAKTELGDMDLYGLTSPEEFLSELFTEGKLIKELSKIEGIDKEAAPNSLLVKIKDWFVECLHLIFKDSPTLLENALYYTEQLIDSNTEYFDQANFDRAHSNITKRILEINNSKFSYDGSWVDSQLQQLKVSYPDFITDSALEDFVSSIKKGQFVINFVVGNKHLFYNRSTVNARILKRLHNGEFALTQESKSKTINQQFKEKQDALRNQLGIVYSLNSPFSAEEARQITQDIVYEISDAITAVERNPELAIKYNSAADVSAVSGMSRKEILGHLGVDNVIQYIKDNNLNASQNPDNIESFEDMDKADAIAKNIDAFLTKGASLFMQLEGFKINRDHIVSDEVDMEVEDENSQTIADEVEEIGGDKRENWGIDSRTEAVFDKASTLVKQALTQCYKLNPDKTPVVSQWGVKQRVDAKEAVQSILKWTQGALSLSSMITKLEAQANKNPWIQPIIDRLKDTSGKESSFQSQFFGVMSKYFQLYSVGKKQGKKYSVFEVNTHPALTDAKRGITGLYNAGVHPLFDSNGRVNTTALGQLKSLWDNLKEKKYSVDNAQELSETLSKASSLLGYPISEDAIVEVLSTSSFNKMTAKSLQFIVKSLEENKDNSSWQPFSGKPEDNGIINNISKFISPITDRLEDTVNTSFFDSGNMYQSNVTPSFVTKLIQKFSNSTKEDYDAFIQDEYGKYAQFKDESGWRNSWLSILDENDNARQVLTHKVQLNFAGKRFMLNRSGLNAMSDAELTLSIIAEYFEENGYNTRNELATSWFRIPLMSNKPSSEFIKFYSYRGANYKNRVLNGCMQLFGQELSRIQTVKKRNKQFDEDAPERINNFDKRGLKFCFFDFLNDVDNNTFRALVDKVTTNTATEAETNELSTLARDLIKEGIEAEWAATRESWREQGIIEAAKTIKGISEEFVESAIENFFWNDFLAANNILNLTITDLAYYKNTEDVQKRLAQLHAPGIRANVEATDFRGNRVADSKTRTAYLKDAKMGAKELKSNIIENLKIIFNRRLETMEGQPQYDAAKAVYDSIIEDFKKNVNITDAQGYASPTSYRKKAYLFGRWDAHSEEIYQKLCKGDYNFTDLKTAFQPLKPFIYSQTEKDSGVDGAKLPTLKVGVQNKNSEYLLMMTGAILQGEETGIPNYLRAIYEVMEDSHRGETVDGNHVPRVDGIDTIQFESTVKAGLTGVIDITEATTTEEAKQLLEDAIYENKKNHLYDKTYVQELALEDYSLQQEVPAHFRDHEQQQGSQIRMITVSDLNPNMKYKIEGKEYSAEEFRKEYEKTISDNIKESIKELRDEFFLHPDSDPIDKNVALARVLQNEILSSPRYGLDLLMSCMLDDNSKFILPLGDATQSRRIEQLVNSIIKNRVNKQKIAGGPVVQVSNFGTSRQLNIRFKSKDGSVLETLAEHIAKGGTEESWVNYIQENQSGIAYYEAFVPAYMQDLFRDFMDAQGNIDIKAIEKTEPELLKMVGYRIPSEDKYSMVPMKIVGFLPKESGDGIMLPYEITLITGSDFDIDKMYLMRKDIPLTLRNRKIIKQGLKEAFGADRIEDINTFLDQITDESKRDEAKATYPDLFKVYMEIAYAANPAKEGRIYRNNKVVDMTWEVLTHEDTADKVLNPGGFEEQKHEGYLVQAARLTGQSISELEKLTTDELKDKCQTNKNLAFIGTHTQFYKQNSAAGSILAIFAVAKVAHACLESNGFTVDVKQVCRIDKPVSIMGLTMVGKIELDAQKDIEGNFIGKTLGSLVASAADAVKDPVLNLMNINSDTVNILNTLIRMGMPFRKAARLLSTQVVTDLLSRYNTEKLSKKTTSLNRILDTMLEETSEEQGDLKDSQLISEDLSEEEVNEAVLRRDTASDYKILLAIQRINQINSAMRGINFATRFNSISSAVGPLIIDNLKIEHNLDNFGEGIYTKEGDEAGFDDVFALHPILEEFSNTVEIAKELFGAHMPSNSNQFRNLLDNLNNTTLLSTIYRDRKVFSKLNDFYQTYLLMANNLVSAKPETVKHYITEFPAEFAKKDYKTKYAGNPFIEAIRFDVNETSKNALLKINVTGLDAEEKSKLTSGWLDLYRDGDEGKKLAAELFNYWFYKGGIGYKPTNPISLLPIQLRERIRNYKETFEKLPDVKVEDVVNQFIRNNWDDDSIVPYRVFEKPLQIHDGGYVDFYGVEATKLNNILSFKTQLRNETVLFIRDQYEIDDFGEVKIVYKRVQPLGNNGEFVEISPVATLNSVMEAPANPVEKADNEGDIVNTEMQEPVVERTVTEDESRKWAQELVNNYFSDSDKTELSKAQQTENAKELIKTKLAKKGVKVNEKIVEEIYKQFC